MKYHRLLIMALVLTLALILVLAMTGCDTNTGMGNDSNSGSVLGTDSNFASTSVAMGKDDAVVIAAAEVKGKRSKAKTSSNSGSIDSNTKSIVSGCDKCHSEKGMKLDPTIPSIAGQFPEYMVIALDSYTRGKRNHQVMMKSLSTLSDVEVERVAKYYGGLTTPWKKREIRKQASSIGTEKSLVTAGQRLSTPCASCHGKDGTSVSKGVPSLAGMQGPYFTKTLRDYFKSHRKDPSMKYFSTSLGKKEIRQLAAYYASLTPKMTKLSLKGNVSAGKKAAAACPGCHGAGGNSINPTIPSIAGQDGEYLLKALKDYRNGDREDEMMKPAVASLSKKQLRDLAAYYSKQKPIKWVAGKKSQDSRFDPLGQGKIIAGSCNGCHGDAGNSRSAGVPNVTGFSAQYLDTAINAYKSGSRKNATMKSMVAFLDAADIEKVSHYYASQTPLKSTLSIKGNAKEGEKLAEKCAGCHGEAGNSGDVKVPSLAGQDGKYLISAINQYKNGKRDFEDMTKAVKALSKKETKNIAVYYSRQTPKKLQVRKLEGPDVLIGKCNRCHGPGGRGMDVKTPKIARQVESYLVKTLQQYRDGTRKHSTMNAMLAPMTNLEINAIANYYARQLQ